MKNAKLDKIDRKILQNLQNDGRMTNVELARRAGISAPPCLRRVRALEETGYIQSYHAKIDAAALGYGVIVFAQVTLAGQADTDLNEFEKHIESWKVVREAYLMTGESDYLLKIVARDWEDYQDFMTNELTAAPGVSSVKSSLAIRNAKDKPGVPIEL